MSIAPPLTHLQPTLCRSVTQWVDIQSVLILKIIRFHPCLYSYPLEIFVFCCHSGIDVYEYPGTLQSQMKTHGSSPHRRNFNLITICFDPCLEKSMKI